MEDTCLYDKFGHCKNQENCSKTHFSQICEKSSNCENVKSCNKRHPKPCKLLANENYCRFGQTCSYDLCGFKSKENYIEMKEKFF